MPLDDLANQVRGMADELSNEASRMRETADRLDTEVREFVAKGEETKNLANGDTTGSIWPFG